MENPTSNTDTLVEEVAEIETVTVERTEVEQLAETENPETSSEQNIFSTKRSVEPWVLGATTVVAGIATFV